MKKTYLQLCACLAVVSSMTAWSKSERFITRFDDATHAKIGAMTGTTGEALVAKRFPEAQLKSFDDIMDAVIALKSGQLDAIVTSFPLAFQISKKNPDLGTLPESLDNEDTAIALKKGNDELLASLNRIITELKRDGTLESMKKRWFKADFSPYQEMNIPLPTEGNVLRIGVSATREPFSFVDKDGRVTGHDGELARMISAKLQRPVEFSNMKFSALLPALQSGKIDLIVTGMTATDERKKKVDFTQPYFINAQVMLVKKPTKSKSTSAAAPDLASNPNDVLSKLEQLDGKRICVLSGSTGDLAARKQFPNATFQVVNASADAALAIKGKKADAFIFDKIVLMKLVEKNQELVILGQPLDSLDVAAVIKKENAELLSDINRALQDLEKEGVLQRLRQKWVDSNYIVTPPLPAINNTHITGVLKMGTCATDEPFAFLADGFITGLDIELGRMIGLRLEKSIEIIDMNFEALIPALQSGKIDFALSNFNVTEERKKLVSFSLPYIKNDVSALVRRSPSPAPDMTRGSQAGHEKLTSATDLSDKRIGVMLGTVHDTYAMEHFPKATILQYKSPSDLILAVKSGKVDAAMYTRESMLVILRDDHELGLLGDSLFTSPMGMGFNKGTDQFRSSFNQFLLQIKQNGVYDDMVNRWIKTGCLQMPEIAQGKTDGVLVVGNVSDKGLPFTVVKDNQLIGFDIELSKRFAAAIGKEIKFADMEFGSLIAALSAGKINMIASTLIITEERKKKVDFSDIYYEINATFFALKERIASTEAVADSAPTSISFFKGISNSFQSNIMQENRYLLILDGLKTTVIISVLAAVFGTLLGALVCFMRMSNKASLILPAKIYISVLRGIPVLVLLMIIFYVVFASININPVLVAVIAFGMNFAAYSAEIFRTGISGVDRGQTEAGHSLGFTRVSTFLHIVLPQTVRRILPVYKGEFISLVKMTSIVGYIAVQDLTKASDIIRSRTFDAFFPLVMVAILYFAVSWFLMQGLEYLERRTDPKQRRRKGAAL